LNAATHFSSGFSAAAPRSRHFGQPAGFGAAIGAGQAFARAQQQFSDAAPQGVTQPHGFTILFGNNRGNPNAAAAWANASTSAVAGRAARFSARRRQFMEERLGRE